MRWPRYDARDLSEGFLHFGVGGFHRSHQALYIDEMIESHGAREWAICGVGIMAQDVAIARALGAQDCLYTLVERDRSEKNARIIGSITSYLHGHAEPNRVLAKLTDPAIKIVSLTATEGGYYFHQGTGELDIEHRAIRHDLVNPRQPETIFGYLAEGLDRRRRAGVGPFTVLSCDNLQHNGAIARRTLLGFAREREPELARWIADNVSFPSCVVDRITPATTDAERQFVREEYGIDDAAPVIAEPFRQWIIEDQFCASRPELERVGVQFTSDVTPYEKMKIRLLNGSHSAMGYLGYLCGYRYIHEIALAPEFQAYLEGLMDREVTPLLGEVPGVDLPAYKRSLMHRFGNEAIKDRALRICLDGSSKLPKFILPSILEQLERGGPIGKLTLCIASWMRFLSGRDYAGNEIPIEDPQAERLTAIVRQMGRDPLPLLRQSDVFGDLASSERFLAEVRLLLDSLYERGPQETLRACSGE